MRCIVVIAYVVTIVFTGTLENALGSNSAEDSSVFGVAAEGYLHNRESFQCIDCSFEVLCGQAMSIQDAVEGRITSNSNPRRGTWLVSGTKMRYDLLCDPKDNETSESNLREYIGKLKKSQDKSKAKEHLVPVPCAPDQYLRNDKLYSLTFGALIGSANLFPKGHENARGIGVTPFDLGVMGENESSNPARYLHDCVSGHFAGKFLGTEKVNNTDLLMIMTGRTPSAMTTKFGFDPVRGYLPAYQSDCDAESGKRRHVVFITDIKACSRERWFPIRTVKILAPDNMGPLKVEELKVTRLDVDTEPSNDRFAMDLPAGVAVSVPGRLEWMTLAQNEHVAAEDLERLHERCIAAGKAYEARRNTNASKESEGVLRSISRSRFTLTVLLAGGLFVLVAIFVARRIRAKRLV